MTIGLLEYRLIVTIAVCEPGLWLKDGYRCVHSSLLLRKGRPLPGSIFINFIIWFAQSLLIGYFHSTH